MAVRGMYDTVRQVFQDIIAPQIEGLKGEMTALRAEQHRLDEKMDLLTTLLTKRLEDGLGAVRAEVSAVRTELTKRLEDGLVALRAEVSAVRTELTKRLEDGLVAVRAEIGAVRTEIGYTNRRLDETLEIRERLATLEAKVAAQ